MIAYHLLADTRGVRAVDRYYEDVLDAARGAQLGDLGTTLFTLMLRLGYQGVPLFMMVSGFGMALNAERRGSTFALDLRSLPRRLRALLVPYWIGFALAVAAMAGLALLRAAIDGTSLSDEFTDGARIADEPYEVSVGALVAGLALVPRGLDWQWVLAPSPSLWFVFLFAQFYVAFPLLSWMLRRVGPWWFLAGAFAITIAARAPLVLSDDGYGLIFHWWIDLVYLPFNVASFALGMTAGWLFIHRHDRLRTWAAGALETSVLLYAGILLQTVGGIASVRAGAPGLVGGPMISLGLALIVLPWIARAGAPRMSSRWIALPAAAGVMSFSWLIASDPLRFVLGTLHSLDAPGLAWVVVAVVYAPALAALALAVDRLSQRLTGVRPAVPAPQTVSARAAEGAG